MLIEDSFHCSHAGSPDGDRLPFIRKREPDLSPASARRDDEPRYGDIQRKHSRKSGEECCCEHRKKNEKQKKAFHDGSQQVCRKYTSFRSSYLLQRRGIRAAICHCSCPSRVGIGANPREGLRASLLSFASPSPVRRTLL